MHEYGELPEANAPCCTNASNLVKPTQAFNGGGSCKSHLDKYRVPEIEPVCLIAGSVTAARMPFNAMRGSILGEQVSPKARASFLMGLLFVIMLQLTFKYGMGKLPKDGPTIHAASDAVFLTYLRMVSSFRESRTSVKGAKPANVGKPKTSRHDLVITQQQRSLHILYRLSRFNGTGHGASRISNVIVSWMGIVGMFSAIVGAVVGPWLAETGDSDDDERFSLWVLEEDEDEDDERIRGLSREEKYSFHRILDVS